MYSNAARKEFGYDPFRISKYPTRVHAPQASSGMALGKDSALKAVFEPVIMRLREADIIEHYSRSTYYYWRPEKEEFPLTALNLRHMVIGYSMYFIGTVISIIIFAYEMWMKRRLLFPV